MVRLLERYKQNVVAELSKDLGRANILSIPRLEKIVVSMGVGQAVAEKKLHGRLKDVEDADMADVTISAPLLKKYKQNLAAYCDGLRDFCARREINSLTVRSDTPIDALILDYLRKRGLLR